MNKKSDYLLLGIILMIIGVYTLIEQILSRNLGRFAFFVVGASLLFLYYTKRKTWALVCSIPIIIIGLTKILPFNIVQSDIMGALILFTMSVILIILFYTKSINVFLIPGCILFCISLYMILGRFIGFIDRPGFFTLFIGFSFILAYIIGKHCFGKWMLYLAIIIIVFSVSSILGFRALNTVVFKGPIVISVVLFIGSILFIKKGLN